MYVDLRTPGVRLPRGRAHALLLRVRAAFAGLAGGITRIVVRVLPADPGTSAVVRNCEIEVHLADGRVEVVRERRRRLAAVLARALLRAWQLARIRLGADREGDGHAKLYAPLHARLVHVVHGTEGGAR
jgi:hypothetical protein